MLARNQMLPQLDIVVQGSQDVGDPGTSSDDKGEFVLVIGATSEVPIQRRMARGKLQSNVGQDRSAYREAAAFKETRSELSCEPPTQALLTRHKWSGKLNCPFKDFARYT